MLAKTLTMDQAETLREARRNELDAWTHYQNCQKSPTYSHDAKEAAYEAWWTAQTAFIELREQMQKR